MISIPRDIPELDFIHPENGCIHSKDSASNTSFFLFGMIVKAENTEHDFAVVRIGKDSNSW